MGLRHYWDLSEFGANGAYVERGAKYATPGSVADCVESSGDREISRRISETDPCPPRGGFGHFTRISRDLSELGENGAYLARGGAEYATPGSVADCERSSGNREILGESQKRTHVARAAGLRHLLGFLGICRNSAKTRSTWRGGVEYATPRIRGRLRRIFTKSRDFSANLRNGSIPHRAVRLRHLL